MAYLSDKLNRDAHVQYASDSKIWKENITKTHIVNYMSFCDIFLLVYGSDSVIPCQIFIFVKN